MKAMFITLFDVKGIINKNLFHKGQQLIEFYKTLKKLLARINRVRPEMKRNDDCFLLYDNALAYNVVNTF